MHVAEIRVWSDPFSGRGCFVHVWDNACEVVLQVEDERVLSVTRPSVNAALETADGWRPPYLARRERRSTWQGDTTGIVRAGVNPRALAADRERRRTARS